METADGRMEVNVQVQEKKEEDDAGMIWEP